MKNRIILSVLLCSVIMLLCRNYVEASEPEDCSHTELRLAYATRYDIGSGGFHVERYVSFYKCKSCNTQITPDVELSRETKACSYYGNEYDNLGHNGDNHTYLLHCKCHSTHMVIVPCIVVDGKHTGPFD